MSSKIVLVILAAVLATALGFPAVAEQETPLGRMVRAASPDPHHHGHHYGGYGIGGYGGYGHGGYGGYGGGYPIGGGFAQSSAHAGSISSPFGSASFASAKAGSSGYGR